MAWISNKDFNVKEKDFFIPYFCPDYEEAYCKDWIILAIESGGDLAEYGEHYFLSVRIREYTDDKESEFLVIYRYKGPRGTDSDTEFIKPMGKNIYSCLNEVSRVLNEFPLENEEEKKYLLNMTNNRLNEVIKEYFGIDLEKERYFDSKIERIDIKQDFSFIRKVKFHPTDYILAVISINQVSLIDLYSKEINKIMNVKEELENGSYNWKDKLLLVFHSTEDVRNDDKYSNMSKNNNIYTIKNLENEKFKIRTEEWGIIEFNFKGEIMAIKDGNSLSYWSVRETVERGLTEGICKGKLFNSNNIETFAFHPYKSIVATGDSAGIIKLWDMNRQCEIKIIDNKNTLYSLVFSPDGKLIASGDYNKKIRIWDTLTGELIQEIDDVETKVEFSPDGKVLITEGFNELRVWNYRNGTLLQAFKTFDLFDDEFAYIAGYEFSPDSKKLAVYTDNKISILECI